MSTIIQLIEWIKNIQRETIIDIAIAIEIIIIFKIFSSAIAYILIKMFNIKNSKKKIKESSFYKPIKFFIVF